MTPPTLLPPAIVLMGPTASGKTALAMALTEQIPCELISVDSAQVFRAMNIGTSKPDALSLERYPHHLIDLISPEESYSAARFCHDALQCMAQITAKGRIPLLVGGTMLYFKALLDGLSELPDANPQLRAELDAKAAREGWPALHAELARIDPISAARLKRTDTQRIQRALEVYYSSGMPLSTHFANTKPSVPPYRFLKLGLNTPERSTLHQRIATRFAAMLDAGLEDEVIQLRQHYALHANLPSMRCVGYRQVWDVLEGQAPRAELCERGIYATRQLAKRQLTWMKNTLNAETFDCLDAHLLVKITERVQQFIHGNPPAN